MIDTDAISLTKKYLQTVKKSGVAIDKAYLFGSFAKGRVWEGSDIDICIISTQFGKNYQQEKSKLNQLALKIDARIEPVPFSPQDFNNKYDPLVTEIKRFGIQI